MTSTPQPHLRPSTPKTPDLSHPTSTPSSLEPAPMLLTPGRPRKYSHQLHQSDISSYGDSIGPSNGSTVHEEAASRYECIAILTEQQNANLKEQNMYLLEQLRKMQDREQRVKKLYDKAKRYKVLWEEARLEIEELRDEIEVYREQAEEMKRIALHDVQRLKARVIQVGDRGAPGMECRQEEQDGLQMERKQSEDSLGQYLKPPASHP